MADPTAVAALLLEHPQGICVDRLHRGFSRSAQGQQRFSDLMVEVFSETIGKHARSAVGKASLSNNIPVEIEMIVEVE